MWKSCCSCLKAELLAGVDLWVDGTIFIKAEGGPQELPRILPNCFQMLLTDLPKEMASRCKGTSLNHFLVAGESLSLLAEDGCWGFLRSVWGQGLFWVAKCYSWGWYSFPVCVGRFYKKAPKYWSRQKIDFSVFRRGDLYRLIRNFWTSTAQIILSHFVEDINFTPLRHTKGIGEN